jgi:hypothetical protein
MNRKHLALLSLFAILFILACGIGSNKALDSVSQTLTPMSELIRQTATARSVEENGSGSDLATAVSKATAKAEGIYATQTARASLNEPSRLATTTAIAPVIAELPRYGVDPASGYVAWIHPPVTIDLNGFQKTGFANDFAQVTAKDFVMAADIKWSSKNSISGCGFMFRSDGDKNAPSQYTVIMTRTAEGHLAFLALMHGEISNYREYYPLDYDRSFQWFNDSSNRLAVVARKNIIDVYTNGVLIGEIDITQPPPDKPLQFPNLQVPANFLPGQLQQFQDMQSQNEEANSTIESQLGDAKKNFKKNQPFLYDGLLGFLGLSQSGHMVCDFNNAWLFVIN